MDFKGFVMSGDDTVAEVNSNIVLPIIKQRMPLYLENGGSFDEWLISRAVDRHRPNSRILKKLLRISDTSDISTVIYAHAATITDDYWIKSQTESLTYEDVYFKENYFADIALKGFIDSYNKDFTQKELTSKTPELTNIGSYEKCWKQENGSWYLYKQGNALERFSEIFISRLCRSLDFPTAEYISVNDFIKTKDFTAGKYNYEPMAAIVGDNEDYSFNYDKLIAIDENLAKEYLDILFMDTLCFNMDRHTYNYGFLRDRQTGKIVCMAPNFDNNIALISRGYVGNAKKSSNLLIELFYEFLKEKSIDYNLPCISKEMVTEISKTSLPNENIDINYAVDFIMDRYMRIETAMQILQLNKTQESGPQLKL